MAKVVRAVIEVGVPDGVTEKDLVLKMRQILKYPIQLGYAGQLETLLKPEVKQYSKVRAAEKVKERAA